MIAASVPTRKATNRSGLWTFLRLLGGWATVAALAYLLWTPNKDWGWVTLLFGWVLLTLLADEFAGWFGYIALVLGILPLLTHTPPQQWLTLLPLVMGALFALLIVKHSGGPFVLPFGAALFAGAILGTGKIGAKLDPSLTFVSNHTFQRMALLAMILGVGFSFVRQLISMLWRWWQAHRLQAALVPAAPPLTTAPVASPVVMVPAPTAPEPLTPASVTVIEANPQPVESASTVPAAAKTALSQSEPAAPSNIVDLDLTELSSGAVKKD